MAINYVNRRWRDWLLSIVISFIYVFCGYGSGVPIAVSKMISEKNAIGDVKGSYEVVKESSFLMITLGLGTSLILFFAKPIISF